jgi:hypothetical protein
MQGDALRSELSPPGSGSDPRSHPEWGEPQPAEKPSGGAFLARMESTRNFLDRDNANPRDIA